MDHCLAVIAGLDPAIHLWDRRCAWLLAERGAILDRRVKPGDDTWVAPSGRVHELITRS